MTMMGTQIDEELYENPWIFKGSPFLSKDIDDMYGFVYCITNVVTGRKYIGRKYFWSFRKPRGKSRRVKSESDWKKYYGSSDELNQERKELGNLSFRRTILSVWNTKGLVNYEETRQLFINNVLCESLNEEPAFYNSNILGRYMRKDYYGKALHNIYGRCVMIWFTGSVNVVRNLSERTVTKTCTPYTMSGVNSLKKQNLNC